MYGLDGREAAVRRRDAAGNTQNTQRSTESMTVLSKTGNGLRTLAANRDLSAKKGDFSSRLHDLWEQKFERITILLAMIVLIVTGTLWINRGWSILY
jgi:hypothetical protein